MPKMQMLKLTFPSKKSTIEQLGSLLTDIDTGQTQENDKFLVTIIRQYLFTLSMMGFSITRFAHI